MTQLKVTLNEDDAFKSDASPHSCSGGENGLSLVASLAVQTAKEKITYFSKTMRLVFDSFLILEVIYI